VASEQGAAEEEGERKIRAFAEKDQELTRKGKGWVEEQSGQE
jgi:hypothetical protein